MVIGEMERDRHGDEAMLLIRLRRARLCQSYRLNRLLREQVPMFARIGVSEREARYRESSSNRAAEAAFEFTGESLSFHAAPHPSRIAENRDFVIRRVSEDEFGGGGMDRVGDCQRGGKLVMIELAK